MSSHGKITVQNVCKFILRLRCVRLVLYAFGACDALDACDACCTCCVNQADVCMTHSSPLYAVKHSIPFLQERALRTCFCAVPVQGYIGQIYLRTKKENQLVYLLYKQTDIYISIISLLVTMCTNTKTTTIPC